MKTYQTESGLAITGEDLEDAIEKNFNEIVRHLQIGNAAGCQIHNVSVECDEEAHVVMLNITACGSDTLSGYDPVKDIPKLYSIHINVEEDDYPIHFEYKPIDKPEFNPFDDTCITSPGDVFGVMLGLIDEIGLHHCKAPLSRTITSTADLRYHGTSIRQLFQHAEYCHFLLMRCMPKCDKETVRLMARMFELWLKCFECTPVEISLNFLGKSRCDTYFNAVGKITALEAIRKEKGLTLEQVADASQMSVMQLKRYEKCHGSTLSNAAKAVHKRLADALGVKISEIVDEFNRPILVNELEAHQNG